MFPILSLKSEVEMPPSSTKVLFNFSNKPNLPGHPSLEHRYLSKQEPKSIMKVTAVTDIHRGTSSEEVCLADVGDLKMNSGKNILVHATENGKLKATTTNSLWILEARFADDCQSSNVILQEGCTSNSILLQVVKPISIGEELQLWFSEPLLATLAIPFLTPVNIQGNKRYVCHRCGRQFENPNPLKIHLSLDCDRLSRQHLWARLRHGPSTTVTDSGGRTTTMNMPAETLPLPYTSAFTTVGFKFELKPREDKCKRLVINEPQDLSTTSNNRHSSSALPSSSIVTNEDFPINTGQNVNKRQISKPVQEQLSARGSAFKPYLHKFPLYLNSESGETNSKNGRPTISNVLPSLRPSVLSQPHYIFHPPPQISPPTNLQLAKTSSSTEQLNASTLFVPRVHQKQNVLSSSNFSLQRSTDDTRPEYHHAAEMETLVSNLGRSKQGHLCIYCGKIYSRKYGLKIHIRTHTGYKPLKCKYCLRPFGDPSNLNKHVRLHAEGDTPYRCELCGKILVRRRDLERHIKSRHAPLETEQHEQANKNQT